VTVILAVDKTANTLWVSVGNIFSLSLEQTKQGQLFMYIELKLWIFLDFSI
jgi:hypothetical protein